MGKILGWLIPFLRSLPLVPLYKYKLGDVGKNSPETLIALYIADGDLENAETTAQELCDRILTKEEIDKIANVMLSDRYSPDNAIHLAQSHGDQQLRDRVAQELLDCVTGSSCRKWWLWREQSLEWLTDIYPKLTGRSLTSEEWDRVITSFIVRGDYISAGKAGRINERELTTDEYDRVLRAWMESGPVKHVNGWNMYMLNEHPHILEHISPRLLDKALGHATQHGLGRALRKIYELYPDMSRREITRDEATLFLRELESQRLPHWKVLEWLPGVIKEDKEEMVRIFLRRNDIANASECCKLLLGCSLKEVVRLTES
jgi:hypothetical protein